MTTIETWLGLRKLNNFTARLMDEPPRLTKRGMHIVPIHPLTLFGLVRAILVRVKWIIRRRSRHRSTVLFDYTSRHVPNSSQKTPLIIVYHP